MDNLIRRIYCYVTEQVFYRMLTRARTEEAFCNEEGRVDIGKLLAELVESYAEGRYCILPEKPKIKLPVNASNVGAEYLKIKVPEEAGPTNQSIIEGA